mmetsp:Transcript_26401/g.36295  ORF Transcript_26401/g.36295 Transcript_26401/m.36295 type:complete len:84 (+) Transcript_26401:270-521(+)
MSQAVTVTYNFSRWLLVAIVEVLEAGLWMKENDHYGKAIAKYNFLISFRPHPIGCGKFLELLSCSLDLSFPSSYRQRRLSGGS